LFLFPFSAGLPGSTLIGADLLQLVRGEFKEILLNTKIIDYQIFALFNQLGATKYHRRRKVAAGETRVRPTSSELSPGRGAKQTART
jgi:hypothetical protein